MSLPQPSSGHRIAALIHLWIGLALAAYLIILSLTGSLIVLRPQFHRWLTQPQIEVRGARLSEAALDGALHRAYPGSVVESIRPARKAEHPSIVTLSHDGARSERLFDPYRGVDLGSAYPRILTVVEWLVRLHDNLLAGSTGRFVNGLGGILLMTLAVTGLVVWWSGKSRWRSTISTGRPAMSSVFARRLHVAMGFWISGLILVWAVTAIYFAFPAMFDGLFDLLDSNPDDDVRPGEQLLDGLIRLHFGRLGGMVGRTTWMVLGLVPSMLVATGVIMWLLRRRRLRPGRVAP
jgi:uncharacterized iron-regulated membrane protein